MSDAGELYFHQDYKNRLAKPTLLSSFVSAINVFAEAIGEGEIKNMIIANRAWHALRRSNVIALCITDQTDSKEFIKEFFLLPLIEAFMSNYKNVLSMNLVEVSSFDNFENIVHAKNEIYNRHALENVNYALTQAISINGAIEMMGIDNLALVLRHASNHKLVIIGDELLITRIGSLIQGMIPISISSKINKYTNLYLNTEYPDKKKVEGGVEFSSFNISNKDWTDKYDEKADFEKNLIKGMLKKKNLGDLDYILLFRKNYIEFLEITQEYIDELGKFKDLPNLEKNLQKLVKDKSKIEFLHGYIKKNMGLDIVKLIKESKN